MYESILRRRNETGKCTPEQQAGEGTECPGCHRMTVHMYSKVCMVPGCEGKTVQLKKQETQNAD